MYVYLIVYCSNSFIGVTDNFEQRLAQHNSSNVLWYPLMILDVPDALANCLLEEWQTYVHIDSRIARGFVLAQRHNLKAYVAESATGLLSQMPAGNVKNLDSLFWESVAAVR
jgi:hypothetical protein